MSADPDDIAKYTNDGVVVIAADAALHAAHPEAVDGRSSEIEMFFVNAADGLTMLEERFDYRSRLSPAHVGVEVDENLRLGQDIAVAPQVPCFRLVDAPRGLDAVARTRAYAYLLDEDRFSLELVE